MRKLAGVGLALLLVAVTAQAQANKSLSQNDHTEIHELYARYAQAIDSSNKEAYAGVFTDDGVFTIDGVRTWTGSKEIASIVGGPRRERPKITHFYSNILINPSSEGAKGSVYVILIDLQKSQAVTRGWLLRRRTRQNEGWLAFQEAGLLCRPGPGPSTGQSPSR